ncbi:methyl-accepting chemotaxis protein [Peribacillus sp. B-H-3]|uniref:methyl-accepting chemotaxis protein n=1 Tax=Peribacillus sp. B-H-3 TaxID=3400420 RepID=UPI003B01A45F
MKRIRLTIGRKLQAAFLSMILLLGMMGGFSIYCFYKMENSSEKIVKDILLVRTVTADMLTQLVNEETGTRGYLVTGEEKYLQPYTEGKAKLQKDIGILRSNQASNPQMKKLLTETFPDLSHLQWHYEKQISLIKQGQLNQASKDIEGGRIYMDSFRKIHKKVEQDNMILTDQALKKAKDAAKQAMILIGVIVSGSLLLAMLLALYLTRSIVRPVKRMTKQFKEIAEGGGDLTKQLKVQGSDELCELAEYFNKTFSVLRKLMISVGEAANQVAAASEELTESSSETSVAAAKISAAMEEVAAGSGQQLSSSSESLHKSLHLAGKIESLSLSVEEAALRNKRAHERADEGADSVRKTLHVMEDVQDKMGNTASAIYELGKQVNRIETILSMIKNISSQTNLLALNASIETARAGEAGKGFSVVANEVRKLAEETNIAAEDIGKLVQEVQGSSHTAVNGMEEGTASMDKGVSFVKQTVASFRHISLSAASVSEKTAEVQNMVEEMSSSVRYLTEESEQVAVLSKEAANNTAIAAASAEEQHSSMEGIAVSAEKLSILAESLLTSVGQFKV